jgi:hypothetical protein
LRPNRVYARTAAPISTTTITTSTLGEMKVSPNRMRDCAAEVQNEFLIGIASSLMNVHMPRAKNIPASVTMNGWMSKKWMTQPIRKPSVGPISSATTSTTPAGTVPLSSIHADTIAVIATTEPTDRSMPPVSSTKVMPTATTSRNPRLMKMLRITCGSENAWYCEAPTAYITSRRAEVASTGTNRRGTWNPFARRVASSVLTRAPPPSRPCRRAPARRVVDGGGGPAPPGISAPG